MDPAAGDELAGYLPDGTICVPLNPARSRRRCASSASSRVENGPESTWCHPSDSRRRIGRPSVATSFATDEARSSVRNEATMMSKRSEVAPAAAGTESTDAAGGVEGAPGGAVCEGGALVGAAAPGAGVGVAGGGEAGRGVITSGADACGAGLCGAAASGGRDARSASQMPPRPNVVSTKKNRQRSSRRSCRHPRRGLAS